MRTRVCRACKGSSSHSTFFSQNPCFPASPRRCLLQKYFQCPTPNLLPPKRSWLRWTMALGWRRNAIVRPRSRHLPRPSPSAHIQTNLLIQVTSVLQANGPMDNPSPNRQRSPSAAKSAALPSTTFTKAAALHQKPKHHHPTTAPHGHRPATTTSPPRSTTKAGCG